MGESRTGLATQMPARSWVWRKSNACGREHRSKIWRTASSMARTSGGGTPRVARAGNRREKIKIRW